jgi:hypothetical protein
MEKLGTIGQDQDDPVSSPHTHLVERIPERITEVIQAGIAEVPSLKN